MLQTNTYGRTGVIRNSSIEKIAILGVQRIASSLMANLSFIEQPGQQVVGFINIDPSGKNGEMIHFPNFLGGIDDIKSIVEQHQIEKVLLAVDPHDMQNLHHLIQKCETENLPYELLPKTFDIDYHQLVSRSAQNGVPEREEVAKELWFQRPLDLLISLMLFMLFLPSWIVIALAIKLESKGGVLYSQERVGENGKIFRIFKFRSMYSDAEKRGGPQLAQKNDPRITKVGHILRKTRLDELPQLFNIIKGDMSFIGPRPERPFFVDKYDEEIRGYKNRLKVKPGLTGHAQVETGYDETLEDVKIKLQHDLYYIEHRHSAKLYFKIWLKTVWVVLTARGQ